MTEFPSQPTNREAATVIALVAAATLSVLMLAGCASQAPLADRDLIWRQVRGPGSVPAITVKTAAEFEIVRRTRGPDTAMVAGPLGPVKITLEAASTTRLDCGVSIAGLIFMPEDRIGWQGCIAAMFDRVARFRRGEKLSAQEADCYADRAAEKAADGAGEFNLARNAREWESGDCSAELRAAFWSDAQ